MRRFVLPLLTLLLACVGAPVLAADNATLTALRQQQAAVYSIVREFHMQTLLSGDPRRTAQLQAAVDASRKAYQSLPDKSGNAALDTAVKEARVAWQRFSKLALANNIAADGYTDDNLIGDLYTEAEALMASLNKAVAAIPGGKQRALADDAHATNLLMQRTVASYLKRGAQMSPDVGSEDSFDVGEATKTLEKKMQKLSRDMAKNPLMHSVNSKWSFIRGSLANYNEKTVPFIVDRYASQINAGLQDVVADLDSK